jgi:NAD(P)-dependent dehydrogenase (short-subunit alcohol dehydrogenase family)
MTSMHIKTALVTGASSGLGLITATALACNNYEVIMVCRNLAKAQAAAATIKQKYPNATLHIRLADLSHIETAATAMKQIAKDFPIIDLLVNNAGLYISSHQQSADGHELTFANNHLSYVNVTYHLLPNLQQAPNARIVNVASQAQLYGKIIENDWQAATRTYQAMRAYANSKLYNIMFTNWLAKDLTNTNITVNCMHPGGVNTNFAKGAKGLTGFVFTWLGKLLRTPEKGAETIIWLCLSDEVSGKTGGYYYDKKLIKAQGGAYSERLLESLKTYSLQMIGL